MTDYRGQGQDELVALIAGADNCGVVEVLPSQSLNDLVKNAAEGRAPVIGVAYRASRPFDEEELGADHRHVAAGFEVYVVDRNEASRAAALRNVTEILARIDTRVDGALSALPPLWAWEMDTEEIVEYENDAVAAIVEVALVVTKAKA